MGPWQLAKRWWHGNAPEWDLVTHSQDGARLLVAELKWSTKPFDRKNLERLSHQVLTKPLPTRHARDAALPVTRAVVVPHTTKGVPRQLAGVHIVKGSDLFV